MTTEEAIQILIDEADYLYGDDHPRNRTAFDIATEILTKAQLSTEDTTKGTTFGKWIPCSERLPEEDRSYLVTNSRWGYPLLEITYRLTDGWMTEGKPIAWMPLPEPWKGETE